MIIRSPEPEVCVAMVDSGAGLCFRCSSTVLAAAVNFSPSSLCLPVADFLSIFMMRAGGSSRCWLMRQIQSLESAAEGKGGAASVPASLAGGRNFRGHSPRSGLLVVFYSISIVFSVKFHGCTVLSG